MRRRRLWQARIYLESCCHSSNTFLTLTYSDDNLPEGGTLVPRHYQLFLKSLRKSIAPATVRYYFVGEYGSQTARPHYHAAIFGLGPEFDYSRFWSHGFVYPGLLTPESAQYIAGYVMKKMTNPDHPDLDGRYPEFARMSLKPGIGANAADQINAQSRDHMPFDVPRTLTVGGKKNVPVGKYLVNKMLEARFSLEDIESIKSARALERHNEMLTMHPDSLYHPQGLKAYALSQTEARRADLSYKFSISGIKNEKI